MAHRIATPYEGGVTLSEQIVALSEQIRALRAQSNRAIAARDAEGVVSFMMPDVTVQVAGGPCLTGRDVSRVAFAEQFADPSFRGYVREPERVELHESGARASEYGEWTGRWRVQDQEQAMRGTYIAEWQLTEMGWRIVSESFR